MGRFQKGQRGGPGRPKGTPNVSPELKVLTKLKREEYSARILQLMEFDKKERLNFLRQTTVPSWEQAIVKMLDKGVSIGDPNRIEKLFYLAFGPQKQPIELTGRDGESLLPKDPELTGKKLTAAIDAVKALMAAKRAGTALPPS